MKSAAIFVLFALTVGFAAAGEQRATAKLVHFDENNQQKDVGHVDFVQKDGKLTISGKVTGLTPGFHGFHVHQNGSTADKCAGAGAHFNPHNKEHGAPTSSDRHVGDLGNIQADSNGNANIQITDSLAQLDGENGIVGRSVVVHEKPDDLGTGGNADSKKTGNAGARYACGVIETSASGASARATAGFFALPALLLLIRAAVL